jgi:hypothetical protein
METVHFPAGSDSGLPRGHIAGARVGAGGQRGPVRGVQTGNEGKVWFTLPSVIIRAKWERSPSVANRFIMGITNLSMP